MPLGTDFKEVVDNIRFNKNGFDSSLYSELRSRSIHEPSQPSIRDPFSEGIHGIIDTAIVCAVASVGLYPISSLRRDDPAG
jgi:hypothetical protein